MTHIHKKDIRYNGTGYNAEWIRKHTTVEEFTEKVKNLTLEQATELYNAAHATLSESEPENESTNQMTMFPDEALEVKPKRGRK